MVDPGRIWTQRVGFSSPGVLKTYANQWEGREEHRKFLGQVGVDPEPGRGQAEMQ
jgi:hypothetical protein